MSPAPDQRPGVAGLTTDHHRRWARGLASLDDIARELGVKRQSVHGAMRRRGWTMENYQEPARDSPAAMDAPAATGSGASSPPAPGRIQRAPAAVTDDLAAGVFVDEATRQKLYVSAGRSALRIATALLGEVDATVTREKGHLTPIAIGRLLENAERALGLMLPFVRPADGEGMTRMSIEVISPEQDAAIQHELADAHDAEADQPSLHPPAGARTNHQQPANIPLRRRVMVQGPLPDPTSFRDWLQKLIEANGKRHARDILLALDPSAPVGFNTPVDQLVELILHRTSGEPQRLNHLL
ncbi:MAG TPA: hypothetical protein VED40_23190 [Azospirillaceae bacterium]|nr:hypothetical protein [Azospirillaceae bacterium]